ncbi:MAG TPA: ester cyclase [Candidatus Acidoferrales bacterium]|jgi:predicted ester cyclase|nr:ester cyclase [Candidatus Acidoferrales bacterium]
MPDTTIQRRLALQPDPATHRAVKRLWVRHSIAEDRRDIDGLVATLTSDCVYEILGTDLRWTGHAGARAFYGELFAAFPDNRFDLTDIVVGPQGVFEAATLTATHLGPFAGLAPTGRPVRLSIAIHFPWDAAARRFTGERIHVDRGALAGGGT